MGAEGVAGVHSRLPLLTSTGLADVGESNSGVCHFHCEGVLGLPTAQLSSYFPCFLLIVLLAWPTKVRWSFPVPGTTLIFPPLFD